MAFTSLLTTAVLFLTTTHSLQSCTDFVGLLTEPNMQLDEVGECNHICNEPSSCNNEIINCYPYTSCSITCSGDSSCNNLTIKSEEMADLQCDGSNSCKHIKFGHDSVATIKYLLPTIELQSNINISDNQTIIGENFMIVKRISTPEILDDIKLTRQRCFGTGHLENRDFGSSDYAEGKGHSVLYCDDCLLDSVYDFYKDLMIAMLEKRRQKIVRETDLNFVDPDEDDYNPDDDVSIEEMYNSPWDDHIFNAHSLEPRVIEYIIYGDEGHIGWHADDDSKVTMVIMISNHDVYSGGVSQFRTDENTDLETYRMTWGDVELHDSNADHQVLPVKNGYRHVFVIEWWDIGRSFRNGRTEIETHNIDLDCLSQTNDSPHCWTEDRGEEFGTYRTREQIIADDKSEEEREERKRQTGGDAYN